MSSPNINNIILLGCILAYLSVFIADRNDEQNSLYCKARINFQVKNSLLLLSFSLSYGALFAKTWRVYTIITACLNWRKLKSRSVTDCSLCLMILGLVCINSLVLVVWFVFDPQTIVTKNLLDKGEQNGDVIIQYAYHYCTSIYQNHFLVTILVSQGILLLLGVFLAWETRKVEFSTLKESRYIGICIYNIVVLSVLCVLVSYSLTEQTTFVYIAISIITVLCTTVTLCLIFVPKVLAYRQYSQGKLQFGSVNTLIGELSMDITASSKACQTDFSSNHGPMEISHL